MAIETMIETIDELCRIHKQLLAVSEEKTAAIVEGDMDRLQKVLIKERKLIQNLELAEKQRATAAEDYAQAQGLKESTVTAILENLPSGVEQEKLEAATVKLAEQLADLRYKEQGNKELLQQSMQFVQYSLSLMNPSIDKMNYGAKKPKKPGNLSVFDSKA